MNEIRVVIIDQSKSICHKLDQTLDQHQHIKLVGYSNDRIEGLDLVKSLQPNVALIDIFFIKESDWHTSIFNDTSVLILARPLVDEVAKTLRAISLGAVDFINKTDLNQLKKQKELISKIDNAFKRKKFKSMQKVKNYEIDEHYLQEEKQHIDDIKKKTQNTVIAIGTSTGGPKALQKVLQVLPKDFPAPIFVVQHMPSGFTKSLAKRLDRHTDLTVKEALNEELVQSGTVYIAPGDYHMIVKQKGKRLFTHIHKGDLNRGHRPSVDTLFNSIAQLNDINIVAIILTGMGKDGAEGVKAIKSKSESAVIIAESEKSAVIFGMPQAALKTNFVTKVAHIDEIGTMIKNFVER